MQHTLNALRMPLSVKKAVLVSPEIPSLDHHIEWKKQKEETVSAHNALGFKGHKATIHHPNLAETNHLLCQIPHRIGFHHQDVKTQWIIKF